MSTALLLWHMCFFYISESLTSANSDTVQFGITAYGRVNHLYIDGREFDPTALPNRANPSVADFVPISARFFLIGIDAQVASLKTGIIASAATANKPFTTSANWKCQSWQSTVPDRWMKVDFDDSAWPAATVLTMTDRIHNLDGGAFGNPSWIWTHGGSTGRVVCRGSPYDITRVREASTTLLCQNGATLQFDVVSNKSSCICAAGYTGQQCEASTSCLSTFQCPDAATVAQENITFACFCLEDRRCLNDKSFCKHGGTPIFDSTTATCRCVCPSPSTGVHCEEASECMHGGKLDSGVCHCSGGHIGKYCGCSTGGYIAGIVILAIVIVGLIAFLVVMLCCILKHKSGDGARLSFRKKVKPSDASDGGNAPSAKKAKTK